VATLTVDSQAFEMSWVREHNLWRRVCRCRFWVSHPKGAQGIAQKKL